MDVRTYLVSDREACLQILDSNIPDFFSPDVAPKFVKFLESAGSTYFVMEHGGMLVGCGGYELGGETGRANLVWGMVRRECQKMGLGRFLLMYRLREIGKIGGIDNVHLDAPARTASFFAGQGFKVASPGAEWVGMVKRLTVCG